MLLNGCSINIDSQLHSFAPMLKKTMPAVVSIYSESRARPCYDPFKDNPLLSPYFNLPIDKTKKPQEIRKCVEQSIGSGVILDSYRGLVITSFHSVELANKIIVALHDKRLSKATIIGLDPVTDLALIKINATGLSALAWADSDQLQVGEFVTAIGSPFGLGQTVTFGIISALNRSGLGQRDYERYIQTDAAINQGNSGGALVNARGELVGINKFIISAMGTNTGVSFAIPSNTAREVARQLLKYGNIKRGKAGIYIKATEHSQAGALISKVVANSSAEKAGLKSGDIIISLNSKPIADDLTFQQELEFLRAGTTVTFGILRNKRKIHIKVLLSEAVQP